MRSRSRWWVLAVIGVCGVPVTATADNAASSAEATSELDALGDVARELYEQGSAAYQKSEFEKAYAAFLGAWRLKNHWQIAVNLGATAMRLGKAREAAEYLRYYLRESPKSDDPATRKEAKDTLAKAKEKIGSLEISVSEPGAEIKVDGIDVGTSPVSASVFVEPGTHRLTAQKGQATAEKEVVIAAGKTQLVALSLGHAEEVAPKARLPIVISGGALSLVAVGFGVGLVVGGEDKGNAALRVSDEILSAGKSCVAGAANYDARCEGVKSESSAADTMNRAGIGLLIGGGVLAAGTLAYWLLAPSVSGKGSVAFVPVVSPTSGGAVMWGAF